MLGPRSDGCCDGTGDAVGRLVMVGSEVGAKLTHSVWVSPAPPWKRYWSFHIVLKFHETSVGYVPLLTLSV